MRGKALDGPDTQRRRCSQASGARVAAHATIRVAITARNYGGVFPRLALEAVG